MARTVLKPVDPRAVVSNVCCSTDWQDLSPDAQRAALDALQTEWAGVLLTARQDPLACDVAAAVGRLRAEGVTLRGIAARLTTEGSKARDGGRWHPSMLTRLAASGTVAA